MPCNVIFPNSSQNLSTVPVDNFEDKLWNFQISLEFSALIRIAQKLGKILTIW